MNYIPKNIKLDSTYITVGKERIKNLNYLYKLYILKRFESGYQLDPKDKKKINQQIDQMAVSLFSEGKNILFTQVGGYGSCTDKLIDSIKINNIKILNLKLCHTCTGSHRDNEFVTIFNNRMCSLLKIHPSDRFTYFLNDGTFQKTSTISNIKMTLNKDRSFKFWEYKKDVLSNYSEGIWKNSGNILILNSQKALGKKRTSNNWIHFNNTKWQIKKNQLFSKKNKYWKLKKTTNSSFTFSSKNL